MGVIRSPFLRACTSLSVKERNPWKPRPLSGFVRLSFIVPSAARHCENILSFCLEVRGCGNNRVPRFQLPEYIKTLTVLKWYCRRGAGSTRVQVPFCVALAPREEV